MSTSFLTNCSKSTATARLAENQAVRITTVVKYTQMAGDRQSMAWYMTSVQPEVVRQ